MTNIFIYLVIIYTSLLSKYHKIIALLKLYWFIYQCSNGLYSPASSSASSPSNKFSIHQRVFAKIARPLSLIWYIYDDVLGAIREVQTYGMGFKSTRFNLKYSYFWSYIGNIDIKAMGSPNT